MKNLENCDGDHAMGNFDAELTAALVGIGLAVSLPSPDDEPETPQ